MTYKCALLLGPGCTEASQIANNRGVCQECLQNKSLPVSTFSEVLALCGLCCEELDNAPDNLQRSDRMIKTTPEINLKNMVSKFSSARCMGKAKCLIAIMTPGGDGYRGADQAWSHQRDN